MYPVTPPQEKEGTPRRWPGNRYLPVRKVPCVGGYGVPAHHGTILTADMHRYPYLCSLSARETTTQHRLV